jgi:SAM-dependent methyltransferase
VSAPDVYTHRFDQAESQQKDAVWEEIVRYLSRWINPDDVVLDLGCDRGHFIRQVRARERWGTDVRDVAALLGPQVRFLQSDGLALRGALPTAYFDVVFASNYLEHLAGSDAVLEQLRVARDLLRPGGRLIVLQPNISLLGGAYWDFIDHRVALNDRSLVEATELAGFATLRLVRRFLPYTTKSRFPQHPLLVRAYLALPPLWLVLGKQTLYVGARD